MTITEMIRSTGEKIFLPFVALCLVGVFSSVSFAEEETPKPVPETSAAGTPHSAPPGKISAPGRPRAKELSGVQKPLNGELSVESKRPAGELSEVQRLLNGELSVPAKRPAKESKRPAKPSKRPFPGIKQGNHCNNNIQSIYTAPLGGQAF